MALEHQRVNLSKTFLLRRWWGGAAGGGGGEGEKEQQDMEPKSHCVSKTAERVTRTESVSLHIWLGTSLQLVVSFHGNCHQPPGKFRVTVAQHGDKQ